MKYLAGYPAPLLEQVRQLMAQEKLGALLGRRYPEGVHDIQTDRALYAYVNELKGEFMRKAEPLSKVMLLIVTLTFPYLLRFGLARMARASSRESVIDISGAPGGGTRQT